jgi:hypothetical protein
VTRLAIRRWFPMSPDCELESFGLSQRLVINSAENSLGFAPCARAMKDPPSYISPVAGERREGTLSSWSRWRSCNRVNYFPTPSFGRRRY